MAGMPAMLRRDRGLALAAVAADGLSLQHLTPELRADREVAKLTRAQWAPMQCFGGARMRSHVPCECVHLHPTCSLHFFCTLPQPSGRWCWLRSGPLASRCSSRRNPCARANASRAPPWPKPAPRCSSSPAPRCGATAPSSSRCRAKERTLHVRCVRQACAHSVVFF